MSKFLVICSVQQDLYPEALYPELEKGIAAAYTQTFGLQAKTKVMWLIIPKGQAFLAGKPSHCATIAATVANGLPKEQRAAFLHAILQEWTTLTRCSKFDVVISAVDASKVKEFVSISKRRFRPTIRPFMLVKMLTTLVKNKLAKGRFEMSINQSEK
ncbi:MAG: hypothetical protein NVS3B3_09190 [Aquirhabdus sp.]